MDRVFVDLAGSFAAGQAYVALSRCMSLHGLKVQNAKGDCAITSNKVRQYNRYVEGEGDHPPAQRFFDTATMVQRSRNRIDTIQSAGQSQPAIDSNAKFARKKMHVRL